MVILLSVGSQGDGEEGEEVEATGTGRQVNLKQLQSLLAQLRKAANHPYLFKGTHDPEAPVGGRSGKRNSIIPGNIT